MRTVCIYHSIDLDGLVSAAIVKHWFIKNNEFWTIKDHSKTEFNTCTNRGLVGIENPQLDFIGYNYGQPIPDLSEYDKVIMCDVSFPATTMSALNIDKTKELIWIDHHISAINDSINPPDDGIIYSRDGSKVTLPYNKSKGLRGTNFAACELTWQFLFPNEPMPEIVRLLGRYDCFGHKGTEEETKVLEFQYGARQSITDYSTAYECLIKCKDDSVYSSVSNCTQSIWAAGSVIYKYLCTEAKQVYKTGFEIEFPYAGVEINNEQIILKHSFICINKERFNPINFGIDYHKDGYDGCACFYFDGTAYNFSLYNDNGLVDCSLIAQQFGGGGHKGASGFRLSIDDFRKLI